MLPKKASSVFLLVSLAMLGFKPQTVHYELVSKIPMEGGSFITDNLQSAYIYSGSVLKKYDVHGKLLNEHDDKSYGKISYIDVNDPMKVMVYYKDFDEIVFLDNTLSPNGNPVNLGDAGYPMAALACGSHNDGAWIYEAQGLQLVRFDNSLGVTQKTGNLVQVLGMPLNPNYLLEYNNYVYLNDTAQGILIFDQYGTYYKTIPIKGLTNFEVRGDRLFYNRGNRIHAFNLNTIMEDVTPAPDSLATNVRIEKNILFEECKDTLRVYKVE